MRRRATPLLVGLVLAALPAAGGSARASAAPHEAGPVADGRLLPNLWTMAPTGFRIHRGRTRTLLRLTNSIVNVGRGPLQLDPKQRDCNGDGDLANDRSAIQRVYADADGDGVYDPTVDTSSATRLAGCFRFDERHAHWHFKDFASYELDRPSDGAVVASHAKVGFCVVDTQQPYPGVPGSPEDRAYVTCALDHVQGLSPGWSDVYDQGLPGQFVDVSSVPDGRYCLRTTVDPANRVLEADEADNTTAVGLRLAGDSVTPVAGVC